MQKISLIIFPSYGLVAYESYASIIYVGGANNKFGTPDQLSDALLSFSLSGGTEDGYVGINEIIDSYSFRDSFDIRKHIVLFTDEVNSNYSLNHGLIDISPKLTLEEELTIFTYLQNVQYGCLNSKLSRNEKSKVKVYQLSSETEIVYFHTFDHFAKSG